MQKNASFSSVEALKIACREQLIANSRDGAFTVPTSKLYPFQWLWDSGFIAIGWATFDVQRAMAEIEALHSAQWTNGFVPHIVFHTPNEGYYPGPDVHGASASPYAPAHVATTGITQPPVIGFVLEKIYQHAPDKAAVLPFLAIQFEKTYRFHEYLYSCRDPKKEGLVYIQHNWESGTDNSPVWDEVWKTFEAPNYELPRRDIQHVNADHRPTHRDYEYYIYLINLFKSVSYDDIAITQQSPFLIQDPLFNAMLAASNESLARIGKLIGADAIMTDQLDAWYQMTRAAMNAKLWSAEAQAYLHYDLRNERLINALTSSSFAPLYAGIPDQERALQLLGTLMGPKFRGDNGEHYLCPSFDTKDVRFNAVKYWRGPVWVNMNWIIYYGLMRYQFRSAAQLIKEDTLELVSAHGLWEYFEPSKARSAHLADGYGAPNFSWTAALILDLLNT